MPSFNNDDDDDHFQQCKHYLRSWFEFLKVLHWNYNDKLENVTYTPLKSAFYDVEFFKNLIMIWILLKRWHVLKELQEFFAKKKSSRELSFYEYILIFL